jgi:hypothetical protein
MKVLTKFLDHITGGGNGSSREPDWRNPRLPTDPTFRDPREPRNPEFRNPSNPGFNPRY